MKEFKGRTAVVTGAASGIGLGMATRFAAEGMNVVLSDIERATLEEAAKSISARGGTVRAVPADVSDPASVAQLAASAIAAFGKVHVLCANAGVASYGSVWEQSLDDWKWTMDVNFWGVVHALRAFIPGMLAHGEAGHIVLTSSAAGLLATTSAAYPASKYAVLAIAEGLVPDLAESRIGVSVLCPGGVKSRIFDSERNRPAGLAERGVHSDKVARRFAALSSPDRKDQVSPAEIADSVIRAMQTDQFYIPPAQEEHRRPIRERLKRILDALGASPTTG